MPKLWLVARHEYLRMVRRRSFLIGTLGVPLLMVVVMGISIYFAIGSEDDRPVGYVDQAGVLGADVAAADALRAVTWVSYPDRSAAEAALEAGQIQAFYVLPAEYLREQRVALYYWDDKPADSIQDAFDDFVLANLAADLPPEVRQRALDGVSMVIRAADGSREVSSKNLVSVFLPFGAGLFFMMAVMTSSGYLLQAVTTEKENRTMEVMVTSLTPEQLIAGKAMGLMAVSMTQLAIWALAVVVGLIVGARFLPVLRAVRVPWAFLGLVALYFVPAFALVAGIMTAIGSAVTESRQGQQVAGMINMLFVLPFFFAALIVAQPTHPVVVALTLFPTTCFLTVALRWSVTVIPVWQLVVGWMVLVAAAAGSIWASARVLRVGMLRYGQRLSWQSVVRAVTGQGSAGL